MQWLHRWSRGASTPHIGFIPPNSNVSLDKYFWHDELSKSSTFIVYYYTIAILPDIGRFYGLEKYTLHRASSTVTTGNPHSIFFCWWSGCLWGIGMPRESWVYRQEKCIRVGSIAAQFFLRLEPPLETDRLSRCAVAGGMHRHKSQLIAAHSCSE